LALQAGFDMTEVLPGVVRDLINQTYKLTELNFTPVSGGCINNGGKLTTAQGTFFIKWNNAVKYPGMFRSEMEGLKRLASAGCVRVPAVQFESIAGDYQFIIMDFVEQRAASASFWEKLGRDLAALHRVTAAEFGLDHDNYIGSLPQSNRQSPDWIDFFTTRRLEPQLELLRASTALRRKFEQLYKRLPEIFPEEKPALLHGDLWSGNLIKDQTGNPCLIDPAIYYGHREIELAFTRLFGGFDNRFYDTYKEVFPLKPGFRDRVDVFNLYPLLVHANLFGGHYLLEIDEIVTHWV
jgi:protein-ribulosamine 3-kinase